MADTERQHIERENGKWSSTVSDADVLDAVKEHSPAATSEVGDEIGMTRAGAHKRLNKLYDSGEVDKKKIGASVAWFVS